MTRILLTVCVSLCATRKYPHVNILRWFAKSCVLPLALSFSPDIDTICYTTLEIDSNNSCRKKLIWIQLDQLKLLDFDSQSNTSSWKLPFKSSVSYPCFWPQNSFFTSQQVSWSLRILKTLSVDAVLLRNDAMMPGEFGPRLSDHAITDDHNTSITLYQRIKKHSSGWLSATEQCCTTVWKYVRKHYLFKNAKFPRTKLEENCEHRGANHVQIKDKFTSIFFRQIEAIGVYYPSNIRKARETELFTNSLWGFHKKKIVGL